MNYIDSKNRSQIDAEIDLVELVKVLWNKKLWILVSALIFTVVAGVYAFTAKEQWTSNATVKAPLIADVSNYLDLQSEYANIINDDKFSPTELLDTSFTGFATALRSNKVKKEFFEQSEWFKSESQQYTTELKKRFFLSELLDKSLQVTVPDLKKTPDVVGINLSFSAERPEDAQKMLDEYISYANGYVSTEYQLDFATLIKQKIEFLTLKKDQIQHSADVTRKLQLDNLTNALQIAKQAGITDYSKTSNGATKIPEVLLGDAQIPFTDSKLSDGTYLFMLGEKYLQAQIDILNKAPVVLPPSYYIMENQVNLLKSLLPKVERLNGVKFYSYFSPADYPVVKDKPKITVILGLGFLLGFIFGCFYIFVSGRVRK